MSQRRLLPCLFCLVFVILGCGDSPYNITRDGITTMHEVADVLSRIPDDESAEEVAADLYKNYLQPLKDKFESIRKRKEVMDKRTVSSKKEAMELLEPTGQLEPESMVAAQRVLVYFGPAGKIAQIRARRIQAEEAKTGKKVTEPDKLFPGLTACMKAKEGIVPQDTGGIGYLKLLREAQKVGGGGQPGMPRP